MPLAAALILCTALYVLLALSAVAVLLLNGGRPAYEETAPADDSALPCVSVLVAARNEEAYIGRCMAALQRQDYPPGKLELVVADDQSSDATARIVRGLAALDVRVVPVEVPPSRDGLRGKAHALHDALRHARGELLLVTDADCAPPPGWARALARRFTDPDLGMVCGVTTVEHAAPVGDVQALDWLLLLGVASAASRVGLPLTAMGNNMAFRRTAYAEVGGYPALPFSVTEDYALFRAIHRTPRWRVQLLLDHRLANRTLPLPTLRQAFQQRKRWARGGTSASVWAYGLYTAVFLAHALLTLGLFFTPLLAVILILLKCGADLAVIAVAMRRLRQRGLLRSFPLFECFLFAYVLAMPFALLLAPRIHWKGRTF
ncbi:MAG TPA: glycosyltransferase [Rhodothermales bacterium]|nr:glycosyltransferase [Rhodothermales bacterium]